MKIDRFETAAMDSAARPASVIVAGCGGGMEQLRADLYTRSPTGPTSTL